MTPWWFRTIQSSNRIMNSSLAISIYVHSLFIFFFTAHIVKSHYHCTILSVNVKILSSVRLSKAIFLLFHFLVKEKRHKLCWHSCHYLNFNFNCSMNVCSVYLLFMFCLQMARFTSLTLQTTWQLPYYFLCLVCCVLTLL